MYVLIFIKGMKFMSKKTKKLVVWIMLIVMIASVLAGVIAYLI